MSKAWASANLVMAPDGTPIMPSSTSVRPKAKVGLAFLLCPIDHVPTCCQKKGQGYAGPVVMPFPPCLFITHAACWAAAFNVNVKTNIELVLLINS